MSGPCRVQGECDETCDCGVRLYFNIPFTMAGFKPGNFRGESLPTTACLAGCQELRKFTIATANGARSRGVRLEIRFPSMTTGSSIQIAPAFSRSSLMPAEPAARLPLRILAEMGIQ